MKICNACGRSISDDSLFCTFCGSKTDIMINHENAATQEDEESQVNAADLEVTETLEVNQQEESEVTKQQNLGSEDIAKGTPADSNPYAAQQPNPGVNPYGAQQPNPAANPYMAPQSNYVQNPYMGQQPNPAANPYMAQQPNPAANPYMRQQPNQPMAQPSYYAQTNMNMQARMMNYDKPLSLGEWLLTLIVIAIPFVNFIMLFIWAFGEGNTNRKNFSRAYLIYMLAIFVLAIVWIILMMVLGAAAYDSIYSYY